MQKISAIFNKFISTKQQNHWYIRFPILLNDDIYFIAGRELFCLSIDSKEPTVVFQFVNDVSHLTSYGSKIACVCEEDGGPDIYILNLATRFLERITFFEKDIRIVEFDDKNLYFLSNKDSAFRQELFLYQYDFAKKQVYSENIGPISWYTRFEKHGDYENYVFQRYGYGYINWKGYKGGTAGALFKNNDKFVELTGNCLRPFYHKNTQRIFFLHDDGKYGNVFSCDNAGQDLKQHTFHQDFQVQDLYLEKDNLIYSKGGQIGIYDIDTNEDFLLNLPSHMPHPDMRTYIPNAQKFLTNIATDGTNVALAIRGHVFTCGMFSGGMKKLTQHLRFRIAGILNNKNIFAFQEPPESALYIYDSNTGQEISKFKVDTGKIAYAKAAPAGNWIAYVNHRHELSIINIKTGKSKLIYKANHPLGHCDWSHDGTHLVYTASGNVYQCAIAVCNVAKNKSVQITNGRYYDSAPTFDPSGKYITFLSNRGIKCMHDGLKFDLAFPHYKKAYIISLQKNQNLLMPWLDKLESEEEKTDKKAEKKKEKKIQIDFDGIEDRILPVPIAEKNYYNIYAIADSKIVLVSASANMSDDEYEESEDKTVVEMFCMKNLSSEKLFANISHFHLSDNKEYSFIEEEGKLKILKTGEKGDETGYKNGGVFDWARWKYNIDPRAEWAQIGHEAWYLMKEFFWSEKLAGIDWDKIWKKYEPYINNIRTKQELDDLIGEIHGELGTSHAFILDNAQENYGYKRGYLGADIEYDVKIKLHKIKRIFKSNLQNDAISPLMAANASVKIGEYIFSIDGVELNENNSVDELLINKGNLWVTLEIGKDKKTKRKVEIKTIFSEKMLRYRAWVEDNSEYVAKISNNKIGYVHISDMQNAGFKEFYQSYLCEYDKQAVVIDVRNNGGGNISCLLLDQLSRKRFGVDRTRWHGLNEIPNEASRGAYILLVNANTGSDAEMFSHQFRLLGLGKIVGQRTWGGVVGIMPRYRLVDGTLTSQPEFGTWFFDVGYNLENIGVIPDVQIINSIDQNVNQEDAQLKKAVEMALECESVDYNKVVESSNHPKRRA